MKVQMSKAQFARLQFADWLQSEFPGIFQRVVAYADAGEKSSGRLKGLGLAPLQKAETKSTWERFLEGATQIGTGLLVLRNQKEMMKLNIERAKMGLPPLDAATSAPVIKTQVDIDPNLANKLISNLGSSMNRNMLIIGGVALAAFLFTRKRA